MIEDFLRELNIKLPGQYNGDLVYVIDIPDSNLYASVFSKLDNNHQLHEEDGDGLEFGKITYTSYDLVIDLYSDFDNDTYRLEIYKKV